MRSLLHGDPGLKHLGREVLRIGVEVPHQPLEVGDFGSGGKGGATPVMEQRTGESCTGKTGVGGGRESFDDQLSFAQARLFAFRIDRGRSEKGIC
jgi:hypothetical protein